MFQHQFFRRHLPDGLEYDSTLGDLVSVDTPFSNYAAATIYDWTDVQLTIYKFIGLTPKGAELRLIEFGQEFPRDLAAASEDIKCRMIDPVNYARDQFAIHNLLVSMGYPDDIWALFGSEVEVAMGMQDIAQALIPLSLAAKKNRFAPFDLTTTRDQSFFTQYCKREHDKQRMQVAVSLFNSLIETGTEATRALLPSKPV